MKNVTFILSLLFMTLSIQVMAKKKQHKIIFQFTNANDTMQQKAFVKQLENLNEFWPTANYEVVLYNQGLELVMKNNSAYLERLKSLKNKGVRFVVCENTLKNRKISKDVFVSELVEYIPAGIAEIVEKQEQGWSYIKGGF